MRAHLIEAIGLSKKYVQRGREMSAVDDVSIAIARGEIVGLVGESGCGKSTLGRLMIGAISATSGEVRYDGKRVSLRTRRDRRLFAKRAQMIFQDPYSSLDPRMTARDIVEEGMIIHGMYPNERRTRALSLLDTVGISRSQADRYPHEFSGGQRQRIGIARALAIEPEFIVCDEPVSALDVSIQAQVVNLLANLRDDLELTYLFISHDLGVVRHISDRIAVMYLGKIVEEGDTESVFASPLHPYTRALMMASPVADPDHAALGMKVLSGEIPTPFDRPEGCSFFSRCQYASDECRSQQTLQEISPGRRTACVRASGGCPNFE